MYLTRKRTIELVACPTCHAPKGQPCDRPEVIQKQRMGWPVPNHQARTAAARNQQRVS